MKILLIMDPGIPVPPKGYGGIERIVAMLAIEYKASQHTVDILASEGSIIEGCNMHSIGADGFPTSKKQMNKAVFTAWKFLWINRSKYDLIHNFGRLMYLLPVLNCRVKKIMCYQREITKKNIQVFNLLPNKNIIYTGCSADLVKRVNAPGKWATIYNGVDFSQFTLRENVPGDAPLIFLGRIEKIKGCHTAIKVALETGNQLIIAGNISSLPEEIDYYENEIKPMIDGVQIKYIGEVNDLQKNKWLGTAKALLMPIEWNEPFGIVMVEAMACGTPVIGFNRGSIPEVIENDFTGFVIKNGNEMIESVKKVNYLNRVEVRGRAKEKFDIKKIAKEYLSVHTQNPI
ncbi:glycosyltransferase family 4 protein [soil metagenome]